MHNQTEWVGQVRHIVTGAVFLSSERSIKMETFKGGLNIVSFWILAIVLLSVLGFSSA